jgi:Mg-chelatase subunit ChlD
MTKPNNTLIAVVLDRSGSMQSVREATVAGFKTFLGEQRAVPGEAEMTLVQFDDEYQVDAWEAPLSKIDLVYTPRGGTALLDALGKTITDVGRSLAARPETHRPSKVVFVVITDGFENASRVFNAKQVFDMISHQREKYSWEFVYLGANQDAIASATSLGMAAASAMTYDASKVGTQNAFSTGSSSLKSFRGGATRNATITPEQRKEYLTNTATGTVIPPSTPDAT